MRLGHGGENGTGVTGDAERDIPVLPDGGVTLVDLHQRQVLGNPLAVSHAEIERRSDDHNHIRVGKGVPAGAIEMMGVVFRKHPPAGPVHVGRNVQRPHEIDGLLMALGGPDLLPEQHCRALGLHQDVGQLLDVRRVANGFRGRPVMSGLRNDRLFRRDFRIKNVPGNFEIGGSAGTVETLPGRHGNHVRHPFGGEYSGGELGDGSHHVHMRQILQGAHPVLGQRALPADMENGAFGTKRRGDPGHRVGAARAGGSDHTSEPSRLARVAVRGMGGSLFVAHVHDADALVDASVVDIDDVAAAQGEDGVHALVCQGLGDQVPAGNHRAALVLLRQRVRGGVSAVVIHGFISPDRS